MKKSASRSIVVGVYLALVVAFVGARPASAAYLDPNTGGMLFQMLAVLFGLFSGLILFFSGRIRMAFYRLMRKLRGSNPEPEQEKTDQ